MIKIFKKKNEKKNNIRLLYKDHAYIIRPINIFTEDENFSTENWNKLQQRWNNQEIGFKLNDNEPPILETQALELIFIFLKGYLKALSEVKIVLNQE